MTAENAIRLGIEWRTSWVPTIAIAFGRMRRDDGESICFSADSAFRGCGNSRKCLQGHPPATLLHAPSGPTSAKSKPKAKWHATSAESVPHDASRSKGRKPVGSGGRPVSLALPAVQPPTGVTAARLRRGRRDQGPAKGVAKRRRLGMTELRVLAMGVVTLGTLLAGPFGAIAVEPDAPASDRELVLGLRVGPPPLPKHPDGTWTGISVELWRHLAEQLSLRYRFEETTQEGLLKGLSDGTLNASGGALTVTAERLREVDFSLPYFVTGLGVAVPLRVSLDWIGVAASFLTIRFLSVVLGIAGVVLLVSVIVWLLERRRTAEFGGPPVDGLACSISWSTQTMAKANPSVSPRTRPGRLLGGAWAATSVALIAMFTAAITSHLTARELSGLVRDAADLHHVRVGTVRDAVAVGYLDREGIHHQDFATIEDGLQAVAAGQLDAVVYDKPILAWLVRQDHPNELQVLGLDLDPLNYAIALPLDSPLRRKLDITLVDTMRSSWWREVVKGYLGDE
jgi:polar amino acid transport system substrate-binding protein